MNTTDTPMKPDLPWEQFICDKIRMTFTKLEGSNQEIKQAFWMMFDPSPAWSYLDKWTNEYFESQLLQKEKENQELKAEIEKLKQFKTYVHDRLDKMGIPSDPEPENNKAHGCRIEGRLNYLEGKMLVVRKKST